MIMNRPTHVIVYEFLPPSDGGIAQMAYNIAVELHRRGRKTALCGFGDLLEDPMYRGIGFDLWKLPRRGWKSLKDLYCTALAIRLYMRYGRNVVLYSLTWKTARMFTAFRKLFGWKLVLFAVGNEITRQIGKKKEPLMRRTFAAVDRISAISNYTAARCAAIGIVDVSINNPGVDEKLFFPLDRIACRKKFGWEGKRVILTAGRLVKRKGQDTVIRAMKKVLEEIPDALYVIAGGGDPEEVGRLKGLAQECGVPDRVVIAGYFRDEDKNALYNASDVYVMVSRDEKGARDIEGFGITFLEAGCCEIPVVGSPCGGIPDAVEEGVNGYLVAPDDETVLAKRLIEILSDETRAKKTGQQARRRIEERFTWKKYADRMVEDLTERKIITG